MRAKNSSVSLVGVEVLRSWEGGPLREFSAIRPKAGWGTPYQGIRSYANSYICETCRRPAVGVYPVRQNTGASTANGAILWVCRPCKTSLEPKQEQPKHLRRKK